MDALITKLFPIARIITPNIPEAEILCGFDIKNSIDMLCAAEKISKYVSGAVLVSDGHLSDASDDLLYIGGEAIWYYGEKVANPNTHGTGCTLSSAIACNLAEGFNLEKSVKNAKDYITGALRAGLILGKGSGPLEHTYAIR